MDSIVPITLFLCFIALVLAIDVFMIHRKSTVISLKEAVWWSVFWIVLSLSFTGVVYYMRGPEGAVNYLTGYVIEKTLSVDNLFVFVLIFDYFQTPTASMHKVLFWGVLGAIVARGILIAVGIELVVLFHWMIYVFGIILVISGLRLLFEKDKKISPEKNPVLKLIKLFIPMTDKYEGDHFFVIKNAKRYATPLFAVLIVIETSDLIFAVDSIPAILAITYDPFVVFSSNVFAILGLRSLHFVLSHLMYLFHYLHYGLSAILLFIGTKMLLSDYIVISTRVALCVVFVILLGSILISIRKRF